MMSQREDLKLSLLRRTVLSGQDSPGLPGQRELTQSTEGSSLKRLSSTHSEPDTKLSTFSHITTPGFIIYLLLHTNAP